MQLGKNMTTTEKWTGRQAAIVLRGDNRWRVSFLATSEGSITELGGMVAEFTTTKAEEAQKVMFAWITSGMVPSGTETHAPNWFA